MVQDYDDISLSCRYSSNNTQNTTKMKRLLFVLLAIAFITACSKDDDNQNQDPNETGHYSLILNGAGFSDQRVELLKDTVNSVGFGTEFSGSDNLGNTIIVIVPTSGIGQTVMDNLPSETDHYTGLSANTSRFSIGNNKYLSKDGSFNVNTNDFDDPCAFWKGSLDINYALEGSDDILNVQGDFAIPASLCYTND